MREVQGANWRARLTQEVVALRYIVSVSQLENDVILETGLCLGLQFVKAKFSSQPLLIFVKGDPWCAILARLLKTLFNEG